MRQAMGLLRIQLSPIRQQFSSPLQISINILRYTALLPKNALFMMVPVYRFNNGIALNGWMRNQMVSNA